MTDEEILKVLGIEDADGNLKMAVLNNFRVAVDARLMNILNELLNEEEVAVLEKMESEGADRSDILTWLSNRVTDIYEMVRALSEDYIQELKGRLSS